jgi:hypothetical protein
VRRSALPLCLLFARLLSACGDGSVSGDPPEPDQDAYPIAFPDRAEPVDSDDWNELDTGCSEKGACPDAAAQPVDASVDGARPDAAAIDVPAGLDPCRTRDDGTWCAGLLGLPSTGLLRCTAHRAGPLTPCPSGCLDRPGATDVCLDDSIDPCFNEPDGLYCGRSIGASTRPNDGFRCMYRRTTWTGRCPGGCAMGAGGITCTP